MDHEHEPAAEEEVEEVEEEEEEIVDFSQGELIPLEEPTEAAAEDDEEEEEEEAEEEEDDAKQVFRGHSDAVLCVAVHGDVVASGGCDERAFLWRLSTGQPVLRLSSAEAAAEPAHTDSVAAVAFSADGSLLATGGLDGRVLVWDASAASSASQTSAAAASSAASVSPVAAASSAASASPVAFAAMVAALDGPADGVEWLAWHARGPVLAAGAGDGTAWLWNARSGACLAVFGGHAGPVTCGCLAGLGKRLATGGADGTVRVWNPAAASAAEHVFRLDADVLCVAAAEREPLLVAGCADGRVVLCSTATGRKVATFRGHAEGTAVEAVAFVALSGDGDEAPVSGGADGTVRVWDAATGTERGCCRVDPPAGVTRMRCVQSGSVQKKPLVAAATTDGRVCVWDARSCSLLAQFCGHSAAVLDIAVAGDGCTLVTGSDDHTCRVFSLASDDHP